MASGGAGGGSEIVGQQVDRVRVLAFAAVVVRVVDDVAFAVVVCEDPEVTVGVRLVSAVPRAREGTAVGTCSCSCNPYR